MNDKEKSISRCKKGIEEHRITHRKLPQIVLVERGPGMHRIACPFQLLHRPGRFHVNYKGLQLWRPQCLYRLVVGTEQTNTSCIHNAPHTLRGCPVEMSFVFAVFNEFARLDVRFHFLPSDEQVLSPRNLSWSDVTGGV